MPADPVDLVLASAPVSMEARYGKLRGAGNSLPTLGLLFLAASARRAGFTTAVVEAGAANLVEAEAAEAILARSPRVVGLSATTLGVHAAARLAGRLKSAAPGLRVVVGGPHPTALPEDTLRRFPGFDAVVVGEGEETLVDLLRAWRAGDDLSAVPGLAWRGPGGAPTRTAPRQRLRALDELARPAWDLLDAFPHAYAPPVFRFQQLPAASLVSSRGCPFECSFCDRSVFGRKYRFHGAEWLLDAIGELWSRGVREILFEDDTFTANKERIRHLCDELPRRFPGLTWSCLARAASVDADTLGRMRRAGCWQISFGIESGDGAVLERMGKSTNLDEIRRGLALTSEAGIRSKGFFILGYPGETKASLERTVSFATSLPLDDVSVSMFTPFPGSPIYAEAARLGRFDEDWEKMSLLNAVFVPEGLTRRDIEDTQARFFRAFYLRPRVVLSYARRVLSRPRTAPAYLRGLATFARSTAASWRA
jgi:radical SAM superfamily enzyme YgiQ (UPF0313 family)